MRAAESVPLVMPAALLGLKLAEARIQAGLRPWSTGT